MFTCSISVRLAGLLGFLLLRFYIRQSLGKGKKKRSNTTRFTHPVESQLPLCVSDIQDDLTPSASTRFVLYFSWMCGAK